MSHVTIPNRVATNSIFLVRESLKELRFHVQKMRDDPDSVSRVARECDLLSSMLKRLEPYLDEPVKNDGAQDSSVKINVRKLTTALGSILGTNTCKKCGLARR